MDFDLTEEQRAIQDTARAFARDEMMPRAREWDEKSIFPVETLRQAAALGFGGIVVKEQHGGANLSRLDSTIIFEELAQGCTSTAAYISIHNMVGWMIDASHNVKDPLEDLLQSVEAILLTYAQALLVDRPRLVAAQQANDTVAAQEVLQNSFRTDTRALVAEARLRAGGALDPLALYRGEKVRERLIKERGAKTVATGL